MAPDSPPESTSHRVTLFYGPEPVEGKPDIQACVFNVKKRSWKAGIQVSVEIGRDQLAAIRDKVGLTERLGQAFSTLAPAEQTVCQERAADFFAQAVTWCKLDLRLESGLTQENQRIQADELMRELEQSAAARSEYVITYVFTELDLAPDHPSSPSR